ncbi:von Willebrand factor C and EGF domain-containing protein isoform X2 [Sceloporus undulatus]|uniref:von Willebrand factor C and EGF domain-containing protein isoform X2 n=1 Tax=Sceloporus undulatus TaxID=8520 RepID=UPI001C4AE3DC|nr:von Willebrand factor C and EGF domain-containing protein isoform X2 [Sceloporus undulatus]
MFAQLLCQAAWLSLLLPGPQGRVYSGRKKGASFALERRRLGPHVCLSGFGNGCCPGWIPAPGSGQCTLPLCSFGCGSGFCIAPNVCSCRDGGQGITCQDPPGACGEYGCDLACNHGGCQEVARVCPLGFSMTETANGVRCTDIDECLSASCEGLCVNTEGGFVCECGPGMKLAADRHSCQDTDECLATPCQHHCKNSIGSYRCSCQTGFYLHGNRHSCMDVNECRRPSEKRTCQHSCHNTLGSFMCSCRPGYLLSVDRVSCEGFSKTGLGPSPILQSLQHPPTLLRLPPESVAAVLPPRVSPPSWAPAPHSAPKTTSPSPSLSTLLVLSQAASSTPSSPLPSSSFGTPFFLRTAQPLVPRSPLPPSLLREEITTTPPPPSPSAPSASFPALPANCWHEGILHENGSHWIEPRCLNCSCEDGQVLCQALTCEVTCSHPILAVEGECCPSCRGCLYYGVSRAEGEVFSLSEENCTVCVCLAGNVSCISPECIPSPCPSSAQSDCCPCQPVECHFRGQTYTEGTEFSLNDDDCTTCVCRQGEVECSFAPCPTLECPQDEWLLAPGQCCFTCRKAAPVTGCFVDDNGVEFPIGQIWSPGDPCELCICQTDGSVSCKRTDCLETCPHPIQIPGQCCPDCSAGCTYAGGIFYNNETFPSVLDPCLSCICLLGSVACSPVDCIVFCTYPFHPEGECCPVCHDCNYKGRKVVNGHSFVPEGEPCIYCTCQLGEVSCEKRSCPSTCTVPFDPPIHCCPDCQDGLPSMEITLTNAHLGDGEPKAALQTLPKHSMALIFNRNCSNCNSTLAPVSLGPEVHFASTLEMPPMSPTAPGNVELHQTRQGGPTRLRLNRPPSVKPPSSWLGHFAMIKSWSPVQIQNRPESIGSSSTRPSGSLSTHSNLPSLIIETTGTSVPSLDGHTSTPLNAANLRNSITSLFQYSNIHNHPLSPPAETLSSSTIPSLPSSQELSGSASLITGSSTANQKNAENSSASPSGTENNLNSTDP